MAHRTLLALAATAAIYAPAAIGQEDAISKVYLEADIVTDNKDEGVLIAEGNVVAKYGERQLTADKVIYYVEKQTVRAIGNVRIEDPDGTVRIADELEVDDRLGDGVATQFAATLAEDAIVVARAANRSGNGTNTLDQAIYTACPICTDNNYTPTWSVRARKAVQNAETKMITYQDAVFEIKGVPILYLPYFAHPDPTTKRRSGLLPPKPGLSSKLGVVYEQPYYWAISPYQDLVIEPRIHTKVNPTLGLEYRKRFYSGTIDAKMSFAYDYEFDSDGERILYDDRGRVLTEERLASYNGEIIPSRESLRSHIFAEGLFDINQDWFWGFGLERVSDDNYIRRYSISDANEKRGLYDTGAQRLLSQIFAGRQTTNFYGDVAMLSVQGLRASDVDERFGVLTPIGMAEQLIDYGAMGLVTLHGSTAILNRDDGDDSRRFSSYADWTNTFIAPAGLVLEPEFKVRADYYDYALAATTVSPEVKDSVTRTTGLAAATLRYPLIRRSASSTILVEPIAMIAYSESNLGNDEVPNEDSLFFEYGMASAFEADPNTNYDLIETGTRAALGLRTVVDFNSMIQLSGAIARRYKEKPDATFSYASNLGAEKSDYLIETGLVLGRNFNINSHFRFDDDFNMQRIETTGSLNFWRLQTDFTYYDRTADIAFNANTAAGQEGINIKANYRVTDHIDLIYALGRNIEDGLNRTQGIGFELHDDCSWLRISWVESEINDRGIGNSSSIKIAFGLKTLGEVSDNTFD